MEPVTLSHCDLLNRSQSCSIGLGNWRTQRTRSITESMNWEINKQIPMERYEELRNQICAVRAELSKPNSNHIR